MSIKDDATTLLIRLAQLQQTHPNFRTEYIEGPDLDKLLQMGPERLSDAVALLEENGYLEVLKTFGTAPYDFNAVMLTSRGRFEAERLVETAATETASTPHEITAPTNGPSTRDDRPPSTVTRFAQPVGSPFGFTVADATELEEMDVEGILAFAERVLPSASNLWVQSSLNQKQRLQQLFFPEGVRFDGKRIVGTGVTLPVFNYLTPVSGSKKDLVDQTGIEPVTS
jgi:hypothetical protein